VMVDRVLDVLLRLQKTDLSILVVEQKLDIAMEIASFAYVLANGRMVYEGPTSEFSESPDLVKRHLGVGV